MTFLGLSLTTNTRQPPLTYLNWIPPPQPRRAASLTLPLQYHLPFHPCQPPCVPPLQEQAENGVSTGGSAVIDDDSLVGVTSSTSAIRREGPLQTWEDHRPITVHFGQVGRDDPQMSSDFIFLHSSASFNNSSLLPPSFSSPFREIIQVWHQWHLKICYDPQKKRTVFKPNCFKVF